MAIEVLAVLEATKHVAEIVEFIAKIKGQLTKNPKGAARDLALALDQIFATFQAVASEIATFQALGGSVEALKERAPALPQLQGVILRTRVRNSKGHSGMIGNIYRSHLDAWFKGALSQVDYLMAKTHFRELGEADEMLFSQMLAISNTISSEARGVEDLTLEGKWDQARERVLASRGDLRSMERILGDTMDRLSDLKTEFISLSGASNLQAI